MNAAGTRAARDVMYVGSQPGGFRQVEAALLSKPGVYSVRWVRSGEAAIIQPVDLVPDVILLGEDQSGAECVHLIRRLLMRWPRAVVLVMVSIKTMAGASKAVMAGARGFVALPLQREDLLTTIDLVLVRDRAGRGASSEPTTAAGRVVVFCAPRGGTGRTTLAANTAVALRSLGEAGVVLVDADYGSPAVDVALNLQGRYQIGDLLAHPGDLDGDLVAQVLAEHASGVQALLAPMPNEGLDPPSPDDVREIIGHLKRDHAWVIVDLGLPLDDLAFSFLDVADRIVLNVVPDLVALRNTRCMLGSMEQRGYAQDRIWLVASRSPAEGSISKADIEARLHVPVVYQIPDDSPLVLFSLNRGVPAVTSHPRSALARAIRSFAQALVTDAGRGDACVPDDASAEHGWLGRLLGRAEARTREPADGDGRADPLARPAEGQPASMNRADLSESLLLEACPYLGLPGETSARFPYPCTANHCCSAKNPVPVDPAYQAETCFGNHWAPCPRFMARLDAADGASADTTDSESGGYEEIVIHAGAADGDGADDLSGSFVLQSCPYLGLAGDDSSRYPYPDAANCCHARDLVRPVTPEYQAKACFGGDWASCPQFKAGLSDSFFLTPAADEETLLPQHEETGSGSTGAVTDGIERDGPPANRESDTVLAAEPAAPAETQTNSVSDTRPAATRADDSTHAPAGPTETCPFLGLRDDPATRRTAPDMEHYCHAGECPQPVQPSYQVSYCLSAHWPLCENWEQATRQPQPARAAGDAADSESGYLKKARQRRGDVLDELDSLSALLRPRQPEPETSSASVAAPAPNAPPASSRPAGSILGEPREARDDASFEKACPHLALTSDPDRWIPRAHTLNGCEVSGTVQSVPDVYQAATCFGSQWRECPRLKAAQARACGTADTPEPEYTGGEVAVDGEERRTPAGHQGAAALRELAPPPAEAARTKTSGPAPCPYLGLLADEEQCRPVPHEDNHCYTGAVPRAVPPSHQGSVCLSGDWQSCPRFLATIDGALLSGAGSSRSGDRSVLPESLDAPAPGLRHKGSAARPRARRTVPTAFWVLLGVALVVIAALMVLRPWAQGPEWLAFAHP